MSTILFDFESRSECDLELLGGRLYWAHPTTRAVCCWLYEVESATWALWLPGDPCPFGPDDVIAAHNYDGFDRFGVAALGWRALDEGPPAIDTSAVARTAGLPGALDELAKRWLGRDKDHAGNAVTRRLSGVKAPLRKVEKGVIDDRTGAEQWGLSAAEVKEWLAAAPSRREVSRVLWEVPDRVQALVRNYEREWKSLGRMPDAIDRELLDYVIGYCRKDVEIMVEAWPELSSWLEADLPGVYELDRRVNDRGIQFDRPLATALMREATRIKQEAVEACAAALECTADEARAAASSPKQFCAITGSRDAQRTTVAAIDHPLARLRQALATIAEGKLEAGLARAPDGRMRDTVRYFGAHTGRWSGRGMQLQNMPRPDKRFEKWGDAEICALADHALAGGALDQQEIDLLVRACLIARPGHVLLWADYSAVEGRGLAWAAGDEPALKVYRDDLDPYVVSAQYIYQGESYEELKAQKSKRQIGKVCELALGYGGGDGAFANMAQGLGIDVSGIDTQAVIKAWRAGRRSTVAFWAKLERALVNAITFQRETSVGAFAFVPGPKQSIAMVLPSGRALVYWGVAIGEGFKGKPSISYEGLTFREHLYGGKIAENAIQAMCRDLLADALVRLEAAGLPVVLHVHDEPVCEVPLAALDRCRSKIGEIMTTLPAWAAGFPPKANVDHGFRYRK